MAAAVGLTQDVWPGLLPTVGTGGPDAELILPYGVRSLRARRAEGGLNASDLELLEAACRADRAVAVVCTDADARIDPGSNGVVLLGTGDRYVLDCFDRTGIHTLQWLPSAAVETVLAGLVAQGNDMQPTQYVCVWKLNSAGSQVHLSRGGQGMSRTRRLDDSLGEATQVTHTETVDAALEWLGLGSA